jgi:hypothetical protein
MVRERQNALVDRNRLGWEDLNEAGNRCLSGGTFTPIYLGPARSLINWTQCGWL